jgi:hypothetical protein
LKCPWLAFAAADPERYAKKETNRKIWDEPMQMTL